MCVCVCVCVIDTFECYYQELVTLHSDPLLKPPEISDAGRHLSAVEFHSVLEKAGWLLFYGSFLFPLLANFKLKHWRLKGMTVLVWT